MFKVICIDNKPRHVKGLVNNGDCKHLVEGEVYQVIKVTQNPNESSAGYKLREVYTTNPYGFASSRFIPCSEIDETELVNTELAHA